MRYRRIIYISVAAFLILYIFNSINDSTVNYNKLPAPISIDTIIEDFEDLSDNSELPSEVVNYQGTKNLYLPLEYTGQSGEVFYLVMASDIYMYKIEALSKDDKDVLVYKLKDVFVNITLPEYKFNIYEIK